MKYQKKIFNHSASIAVIVLLSGCVNNERIFIPSKIELPTSLPTIEYTPPKPKPERNSILAPNKAYNHDKTMNNLLTPLPTTHPTQGQAGELLKRINKTEEYKIKRKKSNVSLGKRVLQEKYTVDLGYNLNKKEKKKKEPADPTEVLKFTPINVESTVIVSKDVKNTKRVKIVNPKTDLWAKINTDEFKKHRAAKDMKRTISQVLYEVSAFGFDFYKKLDNKGFLDSRLKLKMLNYNRVADPISDKIQQELKLSLHDTESQFSINFIDSQLKGVNSVQDANNLSKRVSNMMLKTILRAIQQTSAIEDLNTKNAVENYLKRLKNLTKENLDQQLF